MVILCGVILFLNDNVNSQERLLCGKQKRISYSKLFYEDLKCN